MLARYPLLLRWLWYLHARCFSPVLWAWSSGISHSLGRTQGKKAVFSSHSLSQSPSRHLPLRILTECRSSSSLFPNTLPPQKEGQEWVWREEKKLGLWHKLREGGFLRERGREVRFGGGEVSGEELRGPQRKALLLPHSGTCAGRPAHRPHNGHAPAPALSPSTRYLPAGVIVSSLLIIEWTPSALTIPINIYYLPPLTTVRPHHYFLTGIYQNNGAFLVFQSIAAHPLRRK